MTQRKPIEKEFKGNLTFHHVDPHMARFHLDGVPEILSKRVIEFIPGVLPNDFELERYDVSGSFEFKIMISKK